MRSDNVTKGVERAPNRSLFYALGYTKEELERPLIGVVCSYNEIVPGHMNLDKIAEAVKAGVRAAGGTPVEFPAIAVCDGIAMGHIGMKYSLVTRDLIADSTEAMALAHQFDGLVMIPNCDKNVPGLLMAAARVNIPTIFCSGGPMLAGRLADGRRSCLSHMFEAVGAYKAGKLDEEGVEDYENNACPTCGSCSGMYTANSMNCLTEAIGMGLRGNGTIPAVWSARLRLAKHAGMQIMELVKNNIRPRDIMTEAAFRPRPPSTTPRRWTWPWAAPPTPCSTCPPSPTSAVLSWIWTCPMRSPPKPPTCATWPRRAILTWRIWRAPAACTP